MAEVIQLEIPSTIMNLTDTLLKILGPRGDGLVVNSLVPNGAAELSTAQLSTGDKLLAIDGLDVQDLNASKQRAMSHHISEEGLCHQGGAIGANCCVQLSQLLYMTHLRAAQLKHGMI
jgi:hypothetical protein